MESEAKLQSQLLDLLDSVQSDLQDPLPPGV